MARRVGILHAGEDVVDDGLRLLRAGVVARDDHEIGQLRGDLAHDGALRLITVAAAAEEHDRAPLGKSS